MSAGIIQAARNIFRGEEICAVTMEKYLQTASAFDEQFRRAESRDEFCYAETLCAAGALERRLTDLTGPAGIACGTRIEFRRVYE